MARSNILGDVRAEHDIQMLDSAFYETPDYRTLLESTDRTVIVGRRGTGKSALAYRLEKHYMRADRTAVIHLSTDEDQIIGLRPLVKLFGADFRLVRAGARVAARYAFLMEIAGELSTLYKFGKADGVDILRDHLNDWRTSSYGFATRLKNKLRYVVDGDADAETRVSDLAQQLDMREIERATSNVLDTVGLHVVIIIDRLDEGYEPDDVGVGLVDGFVHAISDMTTKYKMVHPMVFLRDNIFRAVLRYDPDFSRGLEGQVLRLHWDEYALFNLVVNRLRVAFGIRQENATRVWNQCTARDMQEKEGFRKCLRLTLYRPRDVLILLNDALLVASRENRKVIVDRDVESTAKQISINRLNDLKKEYSSIFPGMELFIHALGDRNPEMSVSEAAELIREVFESDSVGPAVSQHIAILETPVGVLRDLYRVGFLGMLDNQSGNYVFCHDGRDPNKEFVSEERIMIHPCYWMAVNASKNALNPEEAKDIYDEYDIEVSSETPAQRRVRIDAVLERLAGIETGQGDASRFEEWCQEAIQIVFAGALRNVELHPNKDAKQRRDIIGTNLCETKAWSRIHADYDVRQVLFEVKNYKGLGIDEYRQVMSYLDGEHGRLGFIVCRDEDENLRKGADLDCMLEMYNKKYVMIIKLTAGFLHKLLSRIRNPQKHDAPDAALNGLLDRYTRVYIGGSSVRRG